MRLEYRWETDEICEIFVNDAYIMTMDHDSHGWDGMRGIREALDGVYNMIGTSRDVVGHEGI